MFEMLAKFAAQQPDHIALQGLRKNSQSIYSYGEYAVAVVATSQALQSTGLHPGDRVLILSGNRPEWVIIDLAAQLIGALPCAVPVFAADTFLQEFINLVRPSVAIVETVDLGNKAHLYGIEHVYQIGLAPFSTCFNQNQVGRIEAVQKLYQAGEETNDDKIAYLTPSSGTTGGIKACCISFGNAKIYGPTVSKLMGLSSKDTAFSFLPLSQTRMQDHFLPLSCGAKVIFTSLDENIYQQVQQNHPTLIASPPFFFEEVRNQFLQAKQEGDSRTLQDFLGGSRHLYTGTTPVDPNLLTFYTEHGCPLLEVYGMTEGSSMATMNYPGRTCLGTQGVIVPNIQLRIAEDGEILIAGPNVCAGYWNDPEKSQAAIRNGWLHTGDIGKFDADGFLHLLGRKKELVVLSNGKKVFPKPIEDVFRSHPLVEHAVLVGNGRKHLGVLIVPRTDIESNTQFFSDIDALVVQINSTLAKDDQIFSWGLADKPFSVETGELTTSFKLRRYVIETQHSDAIERLFASQMVSVKV